MERYEIFTVAHPLECMTYLITFSTYGSHLHGDERGSVDRDHNLPGSRSCAPNHNRKRFEEQQMTQAPYLMGEPRRRLVLEGIRDACGKRTWTLIAAHVRENHVHAIVDASCEPGKIAHALKSYASKHLNLADIDAPDRKRWTRHFSERPLPNRDAVDRAAHYVAASQGDPMALHVECRQ
jgi:REP element-mobilizing transposase RayT